MHVSRGIHYWLSITSFINKGHKVIGLLLLLLPWEPNIDLG